MAKGPSPQAAANRAINAPGPGRRHRGATTPAGARPHRRRGERHLTTGAVRAAGSHSHLRSHRGPDTRGATTRTVALRRPRGYMCPVPRTPPQVPAGSDPPPTAAPHEETLGRGGAGPGCSAPRPSGSLTRRRLLPRYLLLRAAPPPPAAASAPQHGGGGAGGADPQRPPPAACGVARPAAGPGPVCARGRSPSPLPRPRPASTRDPCVQDRPHKAKNVATAQPRPRTCAAKPAHGWGEPVPSTPGGGRCPPHACGERGPS